MRAWVRLMFSRDALWVLNALFIGLSCSVVVSDALSCFFWIRTTFPACFCGIRLRIFLVFLLNRNRKESLRLIKFWSSLFRFQCRQNFFWYSAQPKNDFIEDTPLQWNLGRWKKALCVEIGNNEVSINESLLAIHARSQGPWFLRFFYLKLE